MKIMAAVPQTKTNTLLAFNFMVVSPLSVAARLSRRRLSNARRFSRNRIRLIPGDVGKNSAFADLLTSVQACSGATFASDTEGIPEKESNH